jgi:hypothetical protein
MLQSRLRLPVEVIHLRGQGESSIPISRMTTEALKSAIILFSRTDVRSGKACQLLGFATQDKTRSRNDSIPVDMIPLEADLTSLLHIYPRGYSLDCADAQPIPANDDGTPSTGSTTSEQCTCDLFLIVYTCLWDLYEFLIRDSGHQHWTEKPLQLPYFLIIQEYRSYPSPSTRQTALVLR